MYNILLELLLQEIQLYILIIFSFPSFIWIEAANIDEFCPVVNGDRLGTIVCSFFSLDYFKI